jgi:hypothetical protein
LDVALNFVSRVAPEPYCYLIEAVGMGSRVVQIFIWEVAVLCSAKNLAFERHVVMIGGSLIVSAGPELI